MVTTHRASGWASITPARGRSTVAAMMMFSISSSGSVRSNSRVV
jgi:hypothetical protein